MQEAAGKRVLMVDDDVVTTDLYEHILPIYGYSVRSCGSIDGAILKLQSSEKPEFDVLVTDFCLHDCHGRTGADLAVWVKEHFPEMQIIVASGCLDHTELPVSVRSHVQLLLKPWLPDQLVALLESPIKGHR